MFIVLEERSLISTASRDLCSIGFAFKAAVFETAVSQTSVYDTLFDTIRTLISFTPFSFLFFFFTFIFKGEMRIFVLRASFFFTFDNKSYVLFGSDSLPILSVTAWKYPKKRLELRFMCSDTGKSVRQSVDEDQMMDRKRGQVTFFMIHGTNLEILVHTPGKFASAHPIPQDMMPARKYRPSFPLTCRGPPESP